MAFHHQRWLSITSPQASHLFLSGFPLTSCHHPQSYGKIPVSEGRCGSAMVCSSVPPSPAHQGVAWALPVLAEFVENPQPWEQDSYSTAFLCRASSRKIPWDVFI